MAQTQTGEGAGNSVLEVLDQRQPTAFYWKLTILACLGGFLFGYDTSNIGSALNFVPTAAGPPSGSCWPSCAGRTG